MTLTTLAKPITLLRFFDPVVYMPTPGIISTKSLGTKMAEAADSFFSYGTDKAYVTQVKDKTTLRVKLIPYKSPLWKTALKIVLLFTPISPIMLVIKLIARANKKFEVIEHLTKRHHFETLRYKYDTKYTSTNDYKNICLRAGIAFDKATPLQKHVLFFADSEGRLTRKSFQLGFERLGSSKAISTVVSAAVFSKLAKHMKISGKVIPLSEIAKGTHHASTGVFNKNGTLNFEKLEELKRRYPCTCINPNFLTQDDLVKMRKENFERDAAKPDAETGKEASKGEFAFALNLFSDCAVVDPFGKVMPAISLQRLERLYTNGPELFEEVAVR